MPDRDPKQTPPPAPAPAVTPQYAVGIAKLVVANDPTATAFLDLPRNDDLARQVLAVVLWHQRIPSRADMAPLVELLGDEARLRMVLAEAAAAAGEVDPIDQYALRALSILEHPAGRASRKLARESILGIARKRP